MSRLALTVALLGALRAGDALGGGAGAGLELARRELVEPVFALSELVLAELDGRPGLELLLIGTQGELSVLARGAERPFPLARTESAPLEDPARTLVDLAPILAEELAEPGREPASQLVLLGPRGAAARPFAAGRFGPPEVLASRARFGLRVGRPRLARIARDVNADGLLDLVVPDAGSAGLWLASRETDGPRFARAAEVALEIEHELERDVERLSDRWASAFSIPELELRDVNGDGRPDLVVALGGRRSWHLQRTDGGLPAAPDVTLELGLFRDTSPRAELAPGRTLAAVDSTQYSSRDLDGDGIPDHVLAHRRKVWVFRGTPEGPQFREPAAILKTAADVTAILLAQLDGDERADLLLVRLEIPSVAALIRGLFGEWEVAIEALGYRNKGGCAFETEPAWRGGLRVRLPSILSIVKEAEALLERFQAASREFRPLALADLDGDGRRDVLLVTPDGLRLELWLAREDDPSVDPESADRLLRAILFEGTEARWDLERILGFLSSMAHRRVERLTAGRGPDAQLVLLPREEARLEGLWVGDLDGDGREEVLLRYEPADPAGRARIDVRGLTGR